MVGNGATSEFAHHSRPRSHAVAHPTELELPLVERAKEILKPLVPVSRMRCSAPQAACSAVPIS